MRRSRYSLESLPGWEPAAPSPSRLHRLRKSITAKWERMSASAPSTPSTVSSIQSYEDDSERIADPSHCHHHDDSRRYNQLRASIQLLQRVEAVRVQHSIHRTLHRFYILHVHLRSSRLPLYIRDPDYLIEHPHGEIVLLRESITTQSKRHAKDCFQCRHRIEFLHDTDDYTDGINRVLRSWKDREQRLEHLVHSLLQLTVGSTHDMYDGSCQGCDASILSLARFLQRQYQPSTGVM